ncbi:hypothetical protein [Aurantibacillus circumpalustris]|uniref:hypothetical protein n=1 Tax=Aurantibacillus circumpalustris TaxID=3036359 RepID=UPI00295AAB18|nr:hypothetical protein [Aurantibacillus circumpalustris]
MKKTILVFAALLFLIGCKKKKDPEPTPVPVVNQISVKINGTDFSCSSCGNSYSSGGLGGINFFEGTSNRVIFSFSGFLAPGTYSLVPFANPSFTYEKDGRYFRGRGTLKLTETDTSANGAVNKFIGTFSCMTDTSNGAFYNFTEGALNINFK